MPKTYSYGTQPTGYRRNLVASRLERKMPLCGSFPIGEKNFFCPQFGGSIIGKLVSTYFLINWIAFFICLNLPKEVQFRSFDSKINAITGTVEGS
jgi:hypothetical protein